MKTKKTGRLFYGWVIVLACVLLSATSTGLLSFFGALFVGPVSEALAVSRSTLMVYSTVFTVVTMLLLPFTGTLFKRLPFKPLLVLGCVLGAASHFCFSFAGSVWGFYIGAAIGGVGNCLFGAIPIALLISNWFTGKKGLATGLAFTGSGLATATLSPLISATIAALGWRWAYRVTGSAILVISLLCILLLVKVRPEDMGLAPLGARPEAGRAPAAQLTGFTRRQVFSLPAFWLFSIAIFLTGAVTMGTQQQLVAYWVDLGSTPAFAANMYALVMLVGIFSKIALGRMFDRLGMRRTCLLACGVAVLAMLALGFFTTGRAVAVPAVLFGMVTSIQVLVASYGTNTLFGSREYGPTYGVVTTILYLGVSAGVLFSARVYDTTGSYQPAWLAFAGAFLLVLAALLAADALSQKAFRNILKTERE